MRLLLDECVPRPLKRDFTGHQVSTVEEAGFKGLQNGRLLRAAAGNFDVLITVDRSIPYQQNLLGLPLAVIILIARRNKYESLSPLVPLALEALKTIQPGSVVQISPIS